MIPAAAGFTERDCRELLERSELTPTETRSELRIVSTDLVVRLNGLTFPLPQRPPFRDLAGTRVEVIYAPERPHLIILVLDEVLLAVESAEHIASTPDGPRSSIDLGNEVHADRTASGSWYVGDEDATVELSVQQIETLAAAAGVTRRPWTAPRITDMGNPMLRPSACRMDPAAAEARALQLSKDGHHAEQQITAPRYLEFGGGLYALPRALISTTSVLVIYDDNPASILVVDGDDDLLAHRVANITPMESRAGGDA